MCVSLPVQVGRGEVVDAEKGAVVLGPQAFLWQMRTGTLAAT